MKIVDYRFGHLVLESGHYTSDVIIGPENVYPNWWRKEGHKLCWEDLREAVEKERPEVVVVGRGKFGMMTILPEVRERLAERGIELVEDRTGGAVRRFNELAPERRTLGAFHLTR